MRKITMLGFGILVFGIIAIAVVGCGQQVPQISTTSSQPKGLTIRGVVYGANIDGNRGNPLSGVVLYLSGDQVNKVATTNANGEYSFTDLPANGALSGSGPIGYNIVATKEGYQRTIVENLNFGSYLTSPVSDNSVLTKDIDMDGDPAVLSITPTPGTTIEAAAQTIAVAFNEAMDLSSVRPTLTSQGMRTFAIADTQTLTTTWSADSKTLYITTGALLANKQYQLQVDLAGIAKDASGYRLETFPNTNSGGLDSTTYNQGSANFYYRTASGGAPGAPGGLLLTVNNIVDINYDDVNGGGESVNLSWLAPSSGAVNGYRVYVATGSSGPWALLNTATSNTLTSNVTAVNTALYGSMYNADCIRQLAFVTDTAHFKVVAYNAEGESAGVTAAERDSVKPTITTLTGVVDRTPATVGIPAAIAAALTDYNTTNTGCYVAFSEPMNPASLTDPTKYTLTTASGASVTGASVVYNSGGLIVVQLTFSAAITTPGVDTVTVSASGPVDLSGNVMNDVGGANVAAIN